MDFQLENDWIPEAKCSPKIMKILVLGPKIMVWVYFFVRTVFYHSLRVLNRSLRARMILKAFAPLFPVYM